MLRFSGVNMDHKASHVTRLHTHFNVVSNYRRAIITRSVPSNQQRIRSPTNLKRKGYLKRVGFRVKWAWLTRLVWLDAEGAAVAVLNVTGSDQSLPPAELSACNGCHNN